MLKTFKAALKRIRPLIESGRECFICTALFKTGNGRFIHRITEQLTGLNGSRCPTYDSWLYQYHRETYIKMTDADVVEGRLQWIDHMIAQETVL